MLKRIRDSFMYFIIWMIVSAIVQKLIGNTDWLNTAITSAIGVFFGMYMGQGIGKDND